MPSVYWTIREKIRLNPAVSKSIYIAQSTLKLFSSSEFSSRVKDAAARAGSGRGVALCVRIRDEAADLREFVEYYLAAGVSQIFFYEARSSDNFREVLEPFVAAGFVTLIEGWPHVPISPAAEHDCILRCIGHYAWIGFVDADEFVVIRDGRSIPDFLDNVPDRIPAVALHWQMFGSSGHTKRPNLPVILAYGRREAKPNLHVKVFVRPGRVRFQRNSHSWYYRGIFSAAVNELNVKVWGSTAVPPTAELAWINHYYHKSLEEFQRKAQRNSILDRVGIQFNSRTPQRGAAYERTANDVIDFAAADYHRGLCTLSNCSICLAMAQSSCSLATSKRDRVHEPGKVTVAIVICTRFRPAALRNCLRAIAALKRAPDELVVVDNSTGDAETESVAREYSASYIVEPALGLSRARNRGLSASKCDVVAYLDDDALPEEHWLERIAEPFENPQVAVVTGEAILPDQPVHSTQPPSPTHLDNTDKQWFEIAAFGGLGIGANMALRRSACKLPGFFDERLGRGAPYHGMEEHHAFTQLLSQSYSAVHVPAAVVYHSSQNTWDIKREARSQFAYSMLLFSEFPDRRADLLRFLFRRMRHKPLNWQRDSPDPGEIISGNWRMLLTASLSGALLYLRTRKRRTQTG
jgi:glycosyltransferase involved in cell wall biosynthesis